MSQRTVVAVENSELLIALKDIASTAGFQILTARDNQEAAKLAADADALILDGSDAQVTAIARNLHAHNPLTLIAAAVSSSAASLPEELDDVLCSPFSKPTLLSLLRRASQMRNLRAEAAFHRSSAIRSSEEGIGRSEAMREAMRAADEMAHVNKPLLIVGEPGTGKDLFARLVHRRSPRAAGPFICVDCSAYPGSLLDRELFGTTSSTGARRGGLIELARGGTLALDRISEMSPAVQQHLLAFLNSAEESANIRIIAMAGTGFARAAEAGAFNKDCFAALSAQTLVLPPLRDRLGDAVLLSDYFLRHCAEMHGKPRLSLDLTAKEALGSYPWPGNIGELKHCIERAVLLASGSSISASQLSLQSGPVPVTQNSNLLSSITPTAPQTRTASATTSLPTAAMATMNANCVAFEVGVSLAEVEKQLILKTVTMTRGNRTKAAQILGISIRTLYSKLLEYDHESTRKAANAEKAPVAAQV